MTLKEIVGINLKYYRYKSGQSQEKFYTNLGLNHKYLASIERGEENISFDYVQELANKLNVDINIPKRSVGLAYSKRNIPSFSAKKLMEIILKN